MGDGRTPHNPLFDPPLQLGMFTHTHIWRINGIRDFESRCVETIGKVNNNEMRADKAGLFMPDLPGISFRLRMIYPRRDDTAKQFAWFHCCENLFLESLFQPTYSFTLVNTNDEELETLIYKGAPIKNNPPGFYACISLPRLFEHLKQDEVIHVKFKLSFTFNSFISDSDPVLLPLEPYPISAANDAEKLYTSKKHTDFTFEVEGHTIKIHKAVLATKSAYFDALFLDPDHVKLGRAVIADVRAEVFEGVMYHIYTGKAPTLLSTSPLDFLKAAENFQLPELKNMAVETLIKFLNVKNACNYLKFADDCNSADLREKACKLIVANLALVVETPSYKKMCDESPICMRPIIQRIVDDAKSRKTSGADTSSQNSQNTAGNGPGNNPPPYIKLEF